MLRFFFTLVIGWSISSWLLSEAFYFFPSAEPVVTDMQEFVTIPRHDDWKVERVEEESVKVVGRLKQTPFYRFFPDGAVERFFLGAKFSSKMNVASASADNGPVVWDDFRGAYRMQTFSDLIPFQWFEL